ncbi:MAG: TolB family protein, partial [Anaerolineales bacterium]
PADFDFFLLSEGGGFLPEGFHDYEQGDVPHWACNAGGWAVDPDDRETDLWVEIAVDGDLLPNWALADEYRPDLEESGGCEGGSCGFNVSLWDRLTPYVQHTVSAYAQDIPSGEWVLLSSSPKELTCRTYDIYIYDTLTRETRQVTDLRDSWEFNPRWSPDGKQIVHDRWSLDFSTHAVHITDLASGESMPLAGAESGSYPTWSPNGQWIAFDREEQGVSNLYILPPEGGVPQLVRADAFMASWAPNSQRLVFNQPSDGSLRTVGLKDGREMLVVERGNGPAWSPNGQWIAYEVDGDIWKVNVDMDGNPLGEPLRLTNETAWESRPSWHNNSHSLAFHANLVQDIDIWSISAKGGEAAWLTGAPGFDDYDANYSNNGRYVAYSSFSPNGQAARQWVAAFTYDLPGDSLTEGQYPYHFEIEWSLPEPGSFSGQGGDFTISGAAPIYDGYVLLRGPFELRGVDTPDGLVCEEVGEINPSQPMRFLMGWLAEGEMTYSEALAHFESMTGRAVWGDGMSAELMRHQVIPFAWDPWFQYVCTWTN